MDSGVDEEMIKTLFGLFLIAHGLVHFLYASILMGLLNPEKAGIPWSGKSWIFSNFFGKNSLDKIGSIFYIGVIIFFVISGFLYLFNSNISSQMIVISSILSTIAIFLYWDGSFNKLIEKGLIGIIINIGLIIIFSTSIDLIDKYIK